MVREVKVASEPDTIVCKRGSTRGNHVRVGPEAGPLPQWLSFGIRDARPLGGCIGVHHAKASMGAMNRNKNARNDARSPDWFSRTCSRPPM